MKDFLVGTEVEGQDRFRGVLQGVGTGRIASRVRHQCHGVAERAACSLPRWPTPRVRGVERPLASVERPVPTCPRSPDVVVVSCERAAPNYEPGDHLVGCGRWTTPLALAGAPRPLNAAAHHVAIGLRLRGCPVVPPRPPRQRVARLCRAGSAGPASRRPARPGRGAVARASTPPSGFPRLVVSAQAGGPDRRLPLGQGGLGRDEGLSCLRERRRLLSPRWAWTGGPTHSGQRRSPGRPDGAVGRAGGQ